VRAAEIQRGQQSGDGGGAASHHHQQQQQQEQQQQNGSLTSDAFSMPQEHPENPCQHDSGGAHHMPSSLYLGFPKLPPDGSTLTPEVSAC
jgi:hypothetical protein